MFQSRDRAYRPSDAATLGSKMHTHGFNPAIGLTGLLTLTGHPTTDRTKSCFNPAIGLTGLLTSPFRLASQPLWVFQSRDRAYRPSDDRATLERHLGLMFQSRDRAYRPSDFLICHHFTSLNFCF